jgi:hypothetical protein
LGGSGVVEIAIDSGSFAASRQTPSLRVVGALPGAVRTWDYALLILRPAHRKGQRGIVHLRADAYPDPVNWSGQRVMQNQRPIPVTVTYDGKCVELAISRDLAETSARELPIHVRKRAGEKISDREIEGQVALELARFVELALTCATVRAVAAEDAAYLIAGMLSPHDWADARRIDLDLHETTSPTRLDVNLIVTRSH